MGEVTRYPHGTFCWVDLGARDVESARGFYEALLGWETVDLDTPDGAYTVARVHGKDVAGMHAHEGGDIHDWDSYVSVDDLDPVLERVPGLGGEVTSGAHDIPGSARMAVIADPSGARVCLWQPLGYRGAGLVNETGTWTWSDLSTGDPAAAERFFTTLFGWAFTEVAPRYWTISMGELLIGGMQAREGGPAVWVPYFVVESAQKAAARVEELGGRVLVAPMDVPAGRFLLVGDPQGATCGLFEMGPDGPARGVDRLEPNPTSTIDIRGGRA